MEMSYDVAHDIVVASYMDMSSDVAHIIVVTSYMDMSWDIAYVIVVTSYMDMSSDVAHAIVVTLYMDISSVVAHVVVTSCMDMYQTSYKLLGYHGLKKVIMWKPCIFNTLSVDFYYMVSSRVISPFSFKTKMTLNNKTPARFVLTTDVEIINKRIIFFKYYNIQL